MRQAGEPSFEDILESIKKVIARDARPDVAPRAPMSAADAAAAIAPALASGPAVTMKPAQPDVLDLTEVAAQIMNEARRGPAAPCAGAQDEDGDSLLPPETTESMRDSLAALAMLAQPGAQPQIVRSGETSLEGMVRDMLRPMLADWLERNLPGMVEKMVAAEIARIAGKRG